MENLDVNVKNWKSLIKTAKLEIQLSDDKTYAKWKYKVLCNGEVMKISSWKIQKI